MKRIILILVTFLFFSCKDKRQNEVSVTETKIDSVEMGDEQHFQIVRDSVRKFCTEDFYGIFDSNLIGMEASDEIEDSNPYEKYGVDYTGACYSTDLLKVQITKKKVTIFNYYDENITKTFEIIDCEINGDSLLIMTNSNQMSKIIIVKKKNVPIFSFKYKGNLNVNRRDIDIRMNEFLTKESDVEKFGGIPDCEDFQG